MNDVCFSSFSSFFPSLSLLLYPPVFQQEVLSTWAWSCSTFLLVKSSCPCHCFFYGSQALGFVKMAGDNLVCNGIFVNKTDLNWSKKYSNTVAMFCLPVGSKWHFWNGFWRCHVFFSHIIQHPVSNAIMIKENVCVCLKSTCLVIINNLYYLWFNK